MRKRSHSIWTASCESRKACRQSHEANCRSALRASKKNVRVCFLVPCSFSAVRHAFLKSTRKRLVLVANGIRMNGGTYTHTRTRMHSHVPTRADEFNEIAESQCQAIAKHTYTHVHPRSHTHACSQNYGKAAARNR